MTDENYKVLVDGEEKLSCTGEGVALYAWAKECEKMIKAAIECRDDAGAKRCVELQVRYKGVTSFARLSAETGVLE